MSGCAKSGSHYESSSVREGRRDRGYHATSSPVTFPRRPQPDHQPPESALKRTMNGKPRRIRLRTVVAYPAATGALAISVALALTPFGSPEVMALTPTTPPAATTTAAPTPSSTSTAPTPSSTTSAPTSSTASATPTPAANPSTSSGTPAIPAGVAVDHLVLARIEGTRLQAKYLPVDESVTDAAPFQTFRVRFQLHNAGTAPITEAPQLEYRAAGSTGYTVVPEKPLNGIPFHVAREWVPSRGLGGGTMQGPLGESIAAADLRIGKQGGLAMNGHRSMGANPDKALTLPSDSYTEQEFTVSLTVDAKYLTGYELRITNGHSVLAGSQVATIRLGAPPASRVSPGQHQGLAVARPKKPSNPASGTGAVK